MKQLSVFFFLVLQCIRVCGQSPTIDSIQARLVATDNISKKLDLLHEYSKKLNVEDNQNALKYAREALQISRSQSKPLEEYKALLNIAEIYKVYTDYEKSLRYLAKAKKIAEQGDNKHLIIPVLNQMARIQMEMSHIKEAFEYLYTSLSLAEELNDIELLVEIYNDLGSFYAQTHDLGRAKSYSHQAFLLSKKIRHKNYYALSNLHLATIYNEELKFDKALSYANEAHSSLKDEQYASLTRLKSLIEMSRAHTGMEDFKEANKKLIDARNLATQIKAKKLLAEIYLYLSQLNEKQRKEARALAYYKLYKTYTDSVFTEEKERSISRMNSLLELEKKDKEIDLLTRDNKIQEEEYRIQTLIRNSFIGGFAFLFIVAFLLYRNNTQTRKINKLLRKQNHEINQQKEAILNHQNHIEKKNKMLELQNYEISLQNEEIESQNKDIKDSIEYAQRIQAAMLPSNERISQGLPEHFIMFKPRDIVSGDFYWFYEKDDTIIISAVDCTGHGVPGAFMSLIANDLLNQIIIEQKILHPDDILNELHHKIMFALNQQETKNRDGMDMAICVIHKDQKKLEFSGAYNPLLYIQNGEISMIKGNSFPIGGWHFMEEERIFTRHEVDISVPTAFYIYSDGYQDQFGGPDGRKLMKSHFRKLLKEIHQLPVNKQKDMLNRTISNWMKGHEQVDDMLIIGVKLDLSA